MPLNASAKRSLEQHLCGWEAGREHVAGYLAARGIGPACSERMRLGYVSDPLSGFEPFVDRLVIPYLSAKGYPLTFRFRCITDHDCRENGHPKYLGLSGAEARLFNVRAVHEADRTICLTEGEIDALTLEQCGYRAVGVPGANSWRSHHPRVFSGFEKVFVFGDGDKAGREFVKTVLSTLDCAVGVNMAESEDVNSLFIRGGQAAIEKLLECDT